MNPTILIHRGARRGRARYATVWPAALACLGLACTAPNGDPDAEGETDGCVTGELGCACAEGDVCFAPGMCAEGVCTPPPPAVCGDGNLDPDEECDLGTANSDAGGCTTACTLARCGDGLVGPGEACDDGNEIDSDECTSACALPTCGDGVVQVPEACDDGNDDDSDACLSTCLEAACGDGIVQQGVEECDDGDMNGMGGCRSDCTFLVDPSCGDGQVEPGEFCFESSMQFPTPAAPSALAVDDLDGDGDLDVAVLSRQADVVTIFAGDGAGGLTQSALIELHPGQNLAWGSSDLVAVDYTDDGKVDLVVTAPAYPGVLGLRNTGPGFSFAAPFEFSLPPVGMRPERVVVGDFDGDGDQDVAVNNVNDATIPYQVRVFLSPAIASAETGGVGPFQIAAGNLDGQGPDELVTLSFADQVGQIYALQGASLQLVHTFDLGVWSLPASPVVTDLDGDGTEDLVFARPGPFDCPQQDPDACLSGRVLVLPGVPGDLTAIEAWTSHVTGPVPMGLVVGDFTADGTLDLATISGPTSEIWVRRESGIGPLGYLERLLVTGGTDELRLASGDLNGDGIDDFLSAHEDTNSLRVVLSTP